MAEIKALTFSVGSDAGAARVVLKAGAPWENGEVLAEAKPPQVLWQGSGLKAEDVRKSILDDIPSKATLDDAGKYLGEFLLGADIRKALATHGTKARSYLDVHPDLDWIPWETAVIPTSKQPAFINAGSPFLRYRPPLQQVQRTVSDRIVMLVVVSVANNPQIGADREVRLLREAIRPVDRLIQMEVLVNPTHESMFGRMRALKPTIFHFIGHGEAGELKLWNGAQNEPWSRQDIGTDLDNAGWIPNFVFLNTCRSLAGSADDSSLDQTWSVAGVFQEKGASAVLAMQGPVSGEASGILAKEFYTEVAKGESIDVALIRGRDRLRRDPNYGKGRDPYLPALVVSGSPDGLLAHTSLRDDDPWMNGKRPYQLAISDCEVLIPAVSQFVDREKQRWNILDQFKAEAESLPAALIAAKSGMGKTWLLAWCIDGWLRRRYPVHYVRMSGCANWLEFIRTIRDGGQRLGIVQSPLPDKAAAYLNWRLNHLALGSTPRPEGSAPDIVPAETLVWNDELKKKAPETYVHAFSALAEALALYPGGNPVILALDDFGEGARFFPSEDLIYLVQHFLRAHILGRDSRIRVVLSLSDSQMLLYQGILPAVIPPLDLPLFSEDLAEYIRLLYKLRYASDLPPRSEQDLPNMAKKFRTGDGLSKLCQRIYEYDKEVNP